VDELIHIFTGIIILLAQKCWCFYCLYTWYTYIIAFYNSACLAISRNFMHNSCDDKFGRNWKLRKLVIPCCWCLDTHQMLNHSVKEVHSYMMIVQCHQWLILSRKLIMGTLKRGSTRYKNIFVNCEYLKYFLCWDFCVSSLVS